MFRTLLAAAAIFGACVAARPAHAADEQLSPAEQQYLQAMKSLNWVRGPQKVTLNNNASLNVPEGYLFLNTADTKRFMELQENPSSGKEYLLAPADMHWFSALEFEAMGYVKDDEKIDASGLLKSIKEGTEESNKERRSKGWSQLHITGWRFEPRYDADTRRLEWAIEAKDDKNNEVVNFNTRILGRRGVTSAVLVADPRRLDAAVAEFKTSLKGFDYLPGETYAEFKSGDKVAEYGLAALVAGGAGAALVKSGALKGLWKLIVGGAIAAIAGIKALFNRNKA